MGKRSQLREDRPSNGAREFQGVAKPGLLMYLNIT
jgi:hypothetical protein